MTRLHEVTSGKIGFIEFGTSEDALGAVQTLNGMFLLDRNMHVSFSNNPINKTQEEQMKVDGFLSQQKEAAELRNGTQLSYQNKQNSSLHINTNIAATLPPRLPTSGNLPLPTDGDLAPPPLPSPEVQFMLEHIEGHMSPDSARRTNGDVAATDSQMPPLPSNIDNCSDEVSDANAIDASGSQHNNHVPLKDNTIQNTTSLANVSHNVVETTNFKSGQTQDLSPSVGEVNVQTNGIAQSVTATPASPAQNINEKKPKDVIISAKPYAKMKKRGMGRVLIQNKLIADKVPEKRRQEIMAKLFG